MTGARSRLKLPSIAIIGAGWAGLACALKLARAGYQPIVFESAPEPGGRARRAKVHDHWRDNGQHLLLAGCRSLSRLLHQLRIDMPRAPFAYSDAGRSVSLHGCTGRTGLMLALLQAKGFNWKERLSLLRAVLGLQLRRWQTPPDQTVAQWLSATRQPASLINDFWEPLALAVMNTPMAQASMSRFAHVLRDTLGHGVRTLDVLQPKADLSASIVAPWVQAIESAGGQVHCSSRITGITRLADGAYGITADGTDITQRFDQIVITLPPWALSNIELPFDTSGLAALFGSQPITTVYLGFDPAMRLPTPLMQLAGPTDTDARIWAMDRVHCGEPGTIAISLSAEGAWTELDAETLVTQCLRNLQQSIGVYADCRWHKIVAIHRATPAATPAATLQPSERQPLPRLYLAGDWTHPTYPATLEAAVESGFTTADQIMADFVRMRS